MAENTSFITSNEPYSRSMRTPDATRDHCCQSTLRRDGKNTWGSTSVAAVYNRDRPPDCAQLRSADLTSRSLASRGNACRVYDDIQLDPLWRRVGLREEKSTKDSNADDRSTRRTTTYRYFLLRQVSDEQIREHSKERHVLKQQGTTESRITETKKPQTLCARGFSELNAWRCPTLTWGDPTLPSARLRFTAEFGMGSGGSTALWSPSKTGNKRICICFLCLVLCTSSSMASSKSFHQLLSTSNALGVIWSSRTGN